MKRALPVLPMAAALLDASADSLTHRWSFNTPGAATHGTVIPDALTAAPATVVGAGATRNGSAVTLPGTGNGNAAAAAISAYVDLPNGIVSSKNNLTLEIWATVVSSRNWQRLFDFGRMNTSGNGEVSNTGASPGGGTQSSDNLMLAIQRGDVLNDQRLAARLDGGTELGTNSTTATSAGTEYHYALTFQAGVGANAATGGRLIWYRNGTQIGLLDTPFRLSQIEDVNNWLGRSQYSADSNANIVYNEVRLRDHALSAAEIATSRTAGPNASIAPLAVADTATLRHGAKVRLNPLANDGGEIVRTSLTITQPPASGTAIVAADGSILYTHTTGTPAGDSLVYQVSNSTGQTTTATVSLTFTGELKIPNSSLNVPAAPPPTAYALPNALGTLTFNQPLALATPPGENRRLFVCEKGGLLKVVPDVTAASPTAAVFLNLPTLLSSRGEAIDTGSECGLLGLAFHPQYTANPARRFLYVFYSVTRGGARYQRVSRFAPQAANPDAADTASELVLIEQRDDFNNHNGGDLHFGPDGFLYISVGDEGNANDDPTFNSQLINKDLFAGILRIDVDKDPVNSIEPTAHAAIPLDGGIARFSIPKSNPFVATSLGGDWDGTYNGSPVSGTVRREFWATGLRNPWRFSFDGNDLWCGDVGQGAREEIDLIVRGGNYGWVFREGTLAGPRTTNPAMPANFDTLYHKPPVHEYPRGDGYSVTGGRVYRGTAIGALAGKYIFADYGSGNVWAMDRNGSNRQRLTGEAGIAGFGVDPSNQDLLAADIGDGIVRRLTSTTDPGGYPATLSATGLFADLTDLSPSPGLTPYTVNLPFWSDHAVKTRWFIVPDGTSTITPSADGLWTLPAGTIWVKHFDMEMQRGVPASRKRVETRLLVKNAAGAYGVSYRWNDAGTEATLVEDAGVNFPLAVTVNGTPAPQTWRIPSRAECMICHTPQGGHALSFNTRQLNLDNTLLGIAGNQLTTLFQQDYLTTSLGSPNLLPRHVRPDETQVSVEARVRSYLAVNCSYCHQAGGTAPSNWDGRAPLTLEQTGLLNGIPVNSGSDPANRLVVPADAAHSVVLSRMAASNGFTRMPPIATNVLDQANIDLVTQWINGELANRRDYAAWRAAAFEPDDDPAGAPEADPDGDGATNREEFLAGTDPRDGSRFLRPDFAGGTLGFSVPANRSFHVESSSDLSTWTPLDIPGNQGLPVAGGLVELVCPPDGPLRFYRVGLREN